MKLTIATYVFFFNDYFLSIYEPNTFLVLAIDYSDKNPCLYKILVLVK